MVLEKEHCLDLLEISGSLISARSLPTILQTIVKYAAEATNAKASSIRLLDETGEILKRAAAYGLSDAYLKKDPVEIERSPIDQKVLQGEVVTITDVTGDPRWRYPEEAKREGIVSVMAAPMFIKNKTIGVLRVYTAEPHIFPDEEKELLKAIARHTAVAIENARLYELAVKNYDELVQEVWRGLPDVWSTVTGAA